MFQRSSRTKSMRFSSMQQRSGIPISTMQIIRKTSFEEWKTLYKVLLFGLVLKCNVEPLHIYLLDILEHILGIISISQALSRAKPKTTLLLLFHYLSGSRTIHQLETKLFRLSTTSLEIGT